MVLTQRERYIAIGAGGLVALVLVNVVFVSPLLARKDDLDAKLKGAHSDLSEAEYLTERSPRLAKRWSTEIGPTLKRTGPDAESQIVNSISNWAKEAGVTLSGVKPDRPSSDKEFPDFSRITVHLTGSGTMAQVGYFLYRVQMSQIPVRVNDLTIGTRKEATDDLAVSLNLSTILFTADADKTAPRAAALPAATPLPATTVAPATRVGPATTEAAAPTTREADK